MTEAEFCKHFEAVTNAIPETNVSPRQAALSCLEAFKRLMESNAELTAEIERLRAYQRRVIDAATPEGYAILDEALLPGLTQPSSREVGMVQRVIERIRTIAPRASLRLVQTPGQAEVTHRLVYVECGCGRRFDSGALPVVCCGKPIVHPDKGGAA